jgi:hypothetical protein
MRVSGHPFVIPVRILNPILSVVSENSAWSAAGSVHDLISSHRTEVRATQSLASDVLIPLDLAALEIPWAHDVRSAVAVQHTLRADRRWSSAEDIGGPAQSPTSTMRATVPELLPRPTCSDLWAIRIVPFMRNSLTAMVRREPVIGVPVYGSVQPFPELHGFGPGICGRDDVP